MGKGCHPHLLPNNDVFLHLISCDVNKLMLEVRLKISNCHLVLRKPRLHGCIGCPASCADLVSSKVAEDRRELCIE